MKKLKDARPEDMQPGAIFEVEPEELTRYVKGAEIAVTQAIPPGPRRAVAIEGTPFAITIENDATVYVRVAGGKLWLSSDGTSFRVGPFGLLTSEPELRIIDLRGPR